MYYVYVLKSTKNGQLYIGSTSDLRRRFKEHLSGKVFTTKKMLPVELRYYEAFWSKQDATEREFGLKKSGSVYMGLKKRISKSLGD